MYKTSCLIIFILGILFTSSEIQSQENKHTGLFLKKHPIDFSFGNASVGIPFSKVFSTVFYPIGSVGTEFYYNQKESHCFYQSVKLSWYYSKYSTSGLILNSEAGFRYYPISGLFTDLGLGLGYTHLFRPNALFKQNGDGNYIQVKDYGSSHVMANFSFSAGYQFNNDDGTPLSIYLRYGNYIDLLFQDDLPAVPHNILQLGIRFYFK